MFVRLTKTVNSKGEIVSKDQIDSLITDRSVDWYCSPFYYGDDALSYFKEHNESIKGYKGDVWTDTLYWDLDCVDFNSAKDSAVLLVKYLNSLGYGSGVSVYFSGNKGVHVFLKTENKFTPSETSAICYNTALKAGVPKDVFDTTVYNTNRIFRVWNTKHPASNLYKILLPNDQLEFLTEEQIRETAKTPDQESPPETVAVNAEALKALVRIKETESNIISIAPVNPKVFNPMDCPPGKRRCIYVLENGYFGPGERENACIRLTAYYKAQGYSREMVYELLNEALERRSHIYADTNSYRDEDTNRILDQVFSDDWGGGTYSCRTDLFLASKCDVGHGACYSDTNTLERSTVVSVAGLVDMYLQYSSEASKDYPKTGLDWLDQKVRIRPRNFSIVNGANGSGKSSIIIQIMENLNKQEVYHLFFSLDMANTSLFEKLGAKYTSYSQFEIESAFNIHTRNKTIMKEVVDSIKTNLPYTFFDFTSSASSKHLETTIMSLKEREHNPIPIKIAFIDYAGRVTGDKDSDFANATANALAANDIAKRTNTHLMYVSQIPREDGDHTRPLYSSRVSKNSGAWEENATFCLNVWRPFGDGLINKDHYVHVYIAKNRSGSLGEYVYWWEGKTGNIRDLAPREFHDYVRLRAQEDLPAPPQIYDENEVDGEEIAAKINAKYGARQEPDEDRNVHSGSVSTNKRRFGLHSKS